MVQAICRTLIHSLWQGLLFAILAGLVMIATRRSAAARRYDLLCGLFFLFLAGCVCTFFWECSTQEHQVTGLNYAIPFVTRTILSVAAINDYFSAHASLIVTGWFIVLSAKWLRIWASMTYMQRVKRHRTSIPPAGWTDKLNSFCEQWGMNGSVLLLESGITKIPVVIGHLRPVIFVPLGLLTGLPQAEVEAVLWHELAHIRRRDYLVNFLQNIAESLFFFNPGLLWMSSLLREERENCCDDMAIAQTKDRAQFVRALISFREHAAFNGYNLAPAFATRKNKLLRRALRIVYKENTTLNPAEKIFLFISCFFLAFLLFVAPAGKPFGSETIHEVATPAPVQAIVARPIALTDMHTNTSPMKEAVRGATITKPYRADPAAATVPIIGKEEEIQAGKLHRVDEQQGRSEKEQALILKKQAEQNEEAARMAAMDKDRLQAMQDEKQAVIDKIRAEKDRLQALKDTKTAEKDKAQADMLRRQIVRDL